MMDLKYDANGLIPAVVQDYETREVLMLAYMNEESYKKTLETKQTWFYSRSRQELWNKGATSGNTQQVKSIKYDCDEDTLLIEVIQKGNACHTGEKSCFYRSEFAETADINPGIIFDIMKTVKDRQVNPVEKSYTNYLFNEGIDKILKKVGEEAAEIIIASKNPDKDELIYEMSDFIYHAIVLLVERGVEIEDILKELTKRH